MKTMAELFDFTGRTAIITGGGGILGGAISAGLAKAGAHVIVVDIIKSNAQSVVDQIRAHGGKSDAFEADLSNETEVEELFKKIDTIATSGIHILVNAISAPIGRYDPEVLPIEEWNKAIASDLTSFFLCSRSAAQRMIKAGNGGAIVNFGSIASVSALGRGQIAYSASKGGITQLTRECAYAWGRYNIRVNGILPSQFINRWWREKIDDPAGKELVDRIISGIPLGRFGEADEIVGPTLFLASDAASMVTGIMLPVDGGNLAMNAGASLGIV